MAYFSISLGHLIKLTMIFSSLSCTLIESVVLRLNGLKARGGGGGDSHMEQTGMLVGNLNLTPKGDHLGVAQAFVNPKGDQSGRGLSKF